MRDPFLRWVEVVGTLEPDEEVTVYAQVSGYVEKILVDLGDRVKERGGRLVLFQLFVPKW